MAVAPSPAAETRGVHHQQFGAPVDERIDQIVPGREETDLCYTTDIEAEDKRPNEKIPLCP